MQVNLRQTNKRLIFVNALHRITTCLAHLTAIGKAQLNSEAMGDAVKEFPLKRKMSPVTVQLNGANFLRPEMRQVPSQPGNVQLDQIISEQIEVNQKIAEEELHNRLKEADSKHTLQISNLKKELTSVLINRKVT